MQDVVFVGVILGFFLVCSMYVRGLERLIGSEGPLVESADPAAQDADRGDAASRSVDEVGA